jgi:hypothetical protein
VGGSDASSNQQFQLKFKNPPYKCLDLLGNYELAETAPKKKWAFEPWQWSNQLKYTSEYTI